MSIYGSTLPFLLPPCFYELSTSVAVLHLEMVIITGNLSTTDDPLERLTLAMSNSIEQIEVMQSRFLHASGDDYTSVDWETFFPLTFKLNRLILYWSNLQGTLPSSFPQMLTYVDLSANSLSGTLPPSLFSEFTNAPQVYVVLTSNNLSGTIPSDLFHPLPFDTLTWFTFLLAFNNLEGTIPPLMYAPLLSIEYLAIDMNYCGLSGTLDALFENSSFPSSTLQVLSLSFAGNGLSGSLPAAWFTFDFSNSSSKNLGYRFDNNAFTGPLPSKILQSGFL